MSADAGTAAVQPGLLGARVKRVEDPRFLTGRARYVDDLVQPGELHVAFVRSPHAHADVLRVDVSRALAAPGVHAVLTGKDLEPRVRPITCDSAYPGWQPTKYHALAVDRVRFVGEAVAAVLSEDRYLAEDACELVEVDYAPREVVASVADAVREGAPRLHDGWRDNLFVRRYFKGGDPDAALAEADGMLELELVSHRHTGIPLETRGVVARFDPAEQEITLWTSTQIPHLVRTGLADCLRIPEHKVRVIAPDVGGGFGIKAHLFPEEIVVSVLAMDSGRPVKWIEDRREHLLASVHAREHRHRITVGYRNDGTVTALKAFLYVDCGAYSVYPWTATMDTGMALGILPGPYRIRDYECEGYSVTTNKCPLGPYRGVSRPAACFSIERAMDAVADALSMDPVQVRRRNLVRADEFPYTSVTGLQYDSGSFTESLDEVCRLAGYQELRAQQRLARARGRHLGIGVGCYTEQTAHSTSEFVKRAVPIVFGYDSALVRMDPSGKVTVQLSTHSHGQGHETTIAQVVADRLAIPLEDVRVTFGDTSNTPYGMGTFASRTAVLSGGAAHLAAGKIGDALLRFAGHVLEVGVGDLEVADGGVRVKGAPERGVAIAQLARWAYHRPEKLPPGMEPLLEASSSYDADPGSGTFANASTLALVEVDAETGGVEVLRYWVVEDCGRIINPTIVEGQVHGGVAQGIGGALLEELVYDEDGQLRTTTFLDYLLPGSTDVPPIEVSHLETPSAFTIGGVKGMGEGGAIAPGAVIAAAVQDAIRPIGRVFVNELPLTPARVRRFVETAKASAKASAAAGDEKE
ncbi:MAG TPA: xanthine dehydrogenase family protein molybdopterin-binding subunit [Actinomycetes bacterium]|jgi:carbon-monoxide dehydrogenase large subunit|nr:xanthine dehydrogenase family protein molybdopterin-binding subunit [Actinomycetes bacterium]